MTSFLKRTKGGAVNRNYLLTSYVVLGYDFEKIILSILNLHLCSLKDVFSGCSSINPFMTEAVII